MASLWEDVLVIRVVGVQFRSPGLGGPVKGRKLSPAYQEGFPLVAGADPFRYCAIPEKVWLGFL